MKNITFVASCPLSARTQNTAEFFAFELANRDKLKQGQLIRVQFQNADNTKIYSHYFKVTREPCQHFGYQIETKNAENPLKKQFLKNM